MRPGLRDRKMQMVRSRITKAVNAADSLSLRRRRQTARSKARKDRPAQFEGFGNCYLVNLATTYAACLEEY
jgi:hypothetical protein